MAFKNETQDDSDLSIIYNGGWNVQGCPTCTANPSADELSTEIYGGTYHESSGGSEAVFFFTGTAVYLYGWRAKTQAGRPALHDSDMTFRVDMEEAGAFRQTAGNSNEFNVLLFQREGLSDGNHMLSVMVSQNSIALLDYLVYTRRDDTVDQSGADGSENIDGDAREELSSTTSPSQTTVADTESRSSTNGAGATQEARLTNTPSSVNLALIAGIAGSVLVILAIAMLLFICRRRRRRQMVRDNELARKSQFLIDGDPRNFGLSVDVKDYQLMQFQSDSPSPAPHTPTFQRQFLDPGTSAHWDSPTRENTPSPQLRLSPHLALAAFAMPPPRAGSPLVHMLGPTQHMFTQSQFPLPLGPPTESGHTQATSFNPRGTPSEVTYPDSLDFEPANALAPVHAPAPAVTPFPFPPPPIPPEPARAPLPSRRTSAASRPASHGAQSVRRLVVYNSPPSDVSASEENGGQDAPVTRSRPSSQAPSQTPERRRRRSPPPPLPSRP